MKKLRYYTFFFGFILTSLTFADPNNKRCTDTPINLQTPIN